MLSINIGSLLIKSAFLWISFFLTKAIGSNRLFDAFHCVPFLLRRLVSTNGSSTISNLSLKERFPSASSINLQELEKKETFAQMLKGMAVHPGGNVDLVFATEVS